MGLGELLFGYSNIDRVLEKADSLKYEKRVSVKDVEKLYKAIKKYKKSRSEWAWGQGIPFTHDMVSKYHNIDDVEHNLYGALAVCRAMKEDFCTKERSTETGMFFLEDINLRDF
jgi:hypothetical protein